MHRFRRTEKIYGLGEFDTRSEGDISSEDECNFKGEEEGSGGGASTPYVGYGQAYMVFSAQATAGARSAKSASFASVTRKSHSPMNTRSTCASTSPKLDLGSRC